MDNSSDNPIKEEELIENVYGYQIVVDEMKVLYNLQLESFDIYKDRAKTILGASSIVVSLFSALQLINVQMAQEWIVFYSVVLILAVTMYVAVIGLCLWVLDTVELEFPVADDWETIYEYYASLEDNMTITKTLLVSYLNSIEVNRPLLDVQKKRMRWASVLLAVIVLLLLFLTLIPRVPVG